jgi:arsenate reductase
LKTNVLFVCIHNSARSQMAEAFLNAACGDRFQAQSAGLEPGKLNPIVVEAMRLRGIDISAHQTKSVDDILKQGIEFEYVITVCDEASAERCPIFPGGGRRLHWGFPDPWALTGSPAEKLSGTARIRDAIEAQVKAWCREVCLLDSITQSK